MTHNDLKLRTHNECDDDDMPLILKCRILQKLMALRATVILSPLQFSHEEFADKALACILEEFDISWTELYQRLMLDASMFDFGHCSLLSRLAEEAPTKKIARLHFDAAQEIGFLRTGRESMWRWIWSLEDQVRDCQDQIELLQSSDQAKTGDSKRRGKNSLTCRMHR